MLDQQLKENWWWSLSSSKEIIFKELGYADSILKIRKIIDEFSIRTDKVIFVRYYYCYCYFFFINMSMDYILDLSPSNWLSQQIPTIFEKVVTIWAGGGRQLPVQYNPLRADYAIFCESCYMVNSRCVCITTYLL